MYLCTRNSKERGFGSVWALWVVVKFCWWAWRWAHLYIIGVRCTSEAFEKKNFSENLVDSKSCRTFAFAIPKKGWSEVSDTWLEFGGDDSWLKRLRSLYDTRLSSRFRSFLNASFWCSEIDRRKKLLQIFGGFKNLSYLCTRNPQEKAVRSSRVKRSWTGAFKELTLAGFIEAIFDIFHN